MVQWERIADDLAGNDISSRLKRLLDRLICTYASVNMTLICVSVRSISATHDSVCIIGLSAWSKVVAFFATDFLPPSVLLGKYGLVCLSCLSSPHFFSLFVFTFLFLPPSLLLPSIFFPLPAAVQRDPSIFQENTKARLSDT